MARITIEEKKIEAVVERAVQRALRELLIDSDKGLEIRSAFVKRLKKSAAEKKQGRIRTFEEVVSSL
ncbi:MAG: hypothetical protein FJY98_02055 [Candidatus Liptonbacteria bacterium]|nr:hypothetical protein [Candidatus Liptonbacteria bacterium]